MLGLFSTIDIGKLKLTTSFTGKKTQEVWPSFKRQGKREPESDDSSGIIISRWHSLEMLENKGRETSEFPTPGY